MDLLEPLKDVVSKLEEPFFSQLTKTLENEAFERIRKIVRQTIQDGAHPATGQSGIFQRCFAIKPGINGLLDLVRTTYTERINDMKGNICSFTIYVYFFGHSTYVNVSLFYLVKCTNAWFFVVYCNS